ncbi:MAG: hypothetical protein V7785_24210 [Bermanella sp.]
MKSVSRLVLLINMTISFFLSPAAMAEEIVYVETSLGVAFHSLELEEKPDASATSTGEYASLSLGYALKHTLNIATTLRFWNTDPEEEYSEHALFHDFHFGGLSVGVDAQFFIPSLMRGPYIKAGRHCWAASISQTFDVWSGSGCSNIAGAGLSWESSTAGGTNFVEIALTRFKKLNSWMLVAGHRF